MKMAKRRKREGGQTLLIGLVALILLMLSAVFLFDVQSVVRAKFKTKTGVDAAALVGANWQRHTLNFVGDINLIKASMLMFTDMPNAPARHFNTEEDARQLARNNDILTEMQIRATFVGPLIGFGSAQQAAKANGLTYKDAYAEVVREHLDRLEYSDVYLPPNVAEELHGFNWRIPYIRMIYALYEDGKGLAVGGNLTSILYPTLSSTAPQFIGYLQNKETYEAINANYWCGLRYLLREDFSSSKWWGTISIVFNSAAFVGTSEYLPVGVNFSHTRSTYESALDREVLQAYLDERGTYPIQDDFDNFNPDQAQDRDGKYDPLRYLTWATFDNRFWSAYGEGMANEWADYLRAPIAERYRYYGCNARMRSDLQPVLISGQVLPVASPTNTDRIRHGRDRLNQSPRKLRATATAKPFGHLEGDLLPHAAARMILPCFERSALIPTSLESSSSPDEFDYEWYAFLTEYLPTLGTVGSISDMGPDVVPVPEHWGWFVWYHNALLKLDDPEWRARGIEWLETPVTDADGNTVGTNEDGCDVPPPGGGGRVPTGPGSLH